jgi:hypothetical protein
MLKIDRPIMGKKGVSVSSFWKNMSPPGHSVSHHRRSLDGRKQGICVPCTKGRILEDSVYKVLEINFDGEMKKEYIYMRT